MGMKDRCGRLAHSRASRSLQERVHHLRRKFYFAESFDELNGKGAFEMRHLFLYVHLCAVHISSKASATAAAYMKITLNPA